MKPFRLSTIFSAALLSLSGLLSASAQVPQIKSVAAPPLRDCKPTEKSDLGVWDDAFILNDQDFIVLRRGEEFFSLALDAPAEPKKLASAPAAKKTQIIAAARVEERLWLILQSSEIGPFALDAFSGDVTKFEIPGLEIPGSQTPGIQSHVIGEPKSALLMVAGGDRATWPRDGNHPIYFWMDLESGKVVRLPSGWDLDYFSANQKVAVFSVPHDKPFERRPLKAVDLRTGATMDETPDRRKEICAPFDWGDTQTVKPLYARRAKTGDAELFAGLSVHGLVVPIDIPLDDVYYLAAAKANDGVAAFRLRRDGSSISTPSPLWVVPFEEGRKPETVATAATDFAMLPKGNGVFVTSGHGHKKLSSEAFFYARGERSTWNVLQGVERLPELDKEFAGKDYIADRLKMQFVESFGRGAHGDLALCLCSQERGDLRAFSFKSREKKLDSVTWRCALVLTSSGERYMTDLFREGNVPDKIWLHNSGKLILGTYIWQESGGKRERKVQLTETSVQMP